MVPRGVFVPVYGNMKATGRKKRLSWSGSRLRWRLFFTCAPIHLAFGWTRSRRGSSHTQKNDNGGGRMSFQIRQIADPMINSLFRNGDGYREINPFFPSFFFVSRRSMAILHSKIFSSEHHAHFSLSVSLIDLYWNICWSFHD